MDSDDKHDDAERTKIREELSSMSFEELQKLKEKLGTKVYNEAMFGTSRSKRKHFKRENKNRPREISSKVPIPAVREVVPVKRNIPRDPRFDSLCGEFKEKAFKSAYSFISKYRAQELEQLREELRDTTDPERKSQIKYLVQRMENQQREEKRQKEKAARKEEEKSSRVQALTVGKKPYFPKKSEKRVMEMVGKYEELKKSGKLKRNIEKHRKKMIAKNRDTISSARSNE